MEKTKLGVSISVVAAALYIVAGFGGIVGTLLLAGYILMFEENSWLKWNAVKAIAFYVCFALLSGIVGIIPDAFSVISGFFSMFGGYMSSVAVLNAVNSFFGNVLQSLVTLCADVFAVVLAFKAYKMSTVKIPVIDDIVRKCMQ